MRYALAIVLLLACSGCARDEYKNTISSPIIPGRIVIENHCPDHQHLVIDGGPKHELTAGCVQDDFAIGLNSNSADGVNADNIHGGGDSTRYKPLTWKDWAGPVHSEEVKTKTPLQRENERKFSGDIFIDEPLCTQGVMQGTQNGYWFICKDGKPEFQSDQQDQYGGVK